MYFAAIINEDIKILATKRHIKGQKGKTMGLSAVITLYVCLHRSKQWITMPKMYKNDASPHMILTWSTFIEEWEETNHNPNTERICRLKYFLHPWFSLHNLKMKNTY